MRKINDILKQTNTIIILSLGITLVIFILLSILGYQHIKHKKFIMNIPDAIKIMEEEKSTSENNIKKSELEIAKLTQEKSKVESSNKQTETLINLFENGNKNYKIKQSMEEEIHKLRTKNEGLKTQYKSIIAESLDYVVADTSIKNNEKDIEKAISEKFKNQIIDEATDSFVSNDVGAEIVKGAIKGGINDKSISGAIEGAKDGAVSYAESYIDSKIGIKISTISSVITGLKTDTSKPTHVLESLQGDINVRLNNIGAYITKNNITDDDFSNCTNDFYKLVENCETLTNIKNDNSSTFIGGKVYYDELQDLYNQYCKNKKLIEVYKQYGGAINE